jgi:hypothetical protein
VNKFGFLKHDYWFLTYFDIIKALPAVIVPSFMCLNFSRQEMNLIRSSPVRYLTQFLHFCEVDLSVEQNTRLVVCGVNFN